MAFSCEERLDICSATGGSRPPRSSTRRADLLSSACPPTKIFSLAETPAEIASTAEEKRVVLVSVLDAALIVIKSDQDNVASGAQ